MNSPLTYHYLSKSRLSAPPSSLQSTKSLIKFLLQYHIMNKKIIMPIVLMTLVGLAIFVVAQQDVNEYNSTMQLEKGWNLVSIYTIDDIFESNLGSGYDSYLEELGVKAVFFWDFQNKEYIRLYPNQEEEKVKQLLSRIDIAHDEDAQKDFYRVISSSMWVYTDKSSSVSYRAETPSSLSSLSLKSGWNFLTTIPKMMNKNLDEFKGDCNIQKAYFWNSEEQDWAMMPLDRKFMESELIGRGFIIKVLEDCTFGESESSTTSPPGLPSDSLVCTESDGGKDYYTKGTSSYPHGPLGADTDSCTIQSPGSTEQMPVEECEGGDDCHVIELFCTPQGEKLDFEIYNCPNGCQDGACIQ